jgi:hypothetical protein
MNANHSQQDNPYYETETVPLPIAFAALTAKLVDLADERGCRVTEVAEQAELTEVARSLLTRADSELIIRAEVGRLVDEFTAEGLADGSLEWVDAEHTTLRKRQPAKGSEAASE